MMGIGEGEANILAYVKGVHTRTMDAVVEEAVQNQSLELLGPKLLLFMGCMKLGEKIAFTCLLWVNKPQIKYPISRNLWEVIISGPVLLVPNPFIEN